MVTMVAYMEIFMNIVIRDEWWRTTQKYLGPNCWIKEVGVEKGRELGKGRGGGNLRMKIKGLPFGEGNGRGTKGLSYKGKNIKGYFGVWQKVFEVYTTRKYDCQ